MSTPSASGPHPGGASRFLDRFRFQVVGEDVVPVTAPPVPIIPPTVPGPVAMARVAMVLTTSVQNKASLNKNKNKNKNKGNLQSGSGSGLQSNLIPAFELRRLHQQPSQNPFTTAQRFTWEQLDVLLPPGPDVTRLETAVMLSLQQRDRERARRKDDIVQESTLDV